jgi:hypothetical protein
MGRIATLPNGIKVNLFDNGTWEFVDEKEAIPSILVASSLSHDINGLNETNFRNTYWGMTRSEVLDSEPTEPVLNTDEHIYFNGELNGISCVIIFNFFKDELTSSSYVF